MTFPDPALFSTDAIDPAIIRLNAEILAQFAGAPDMWSFPPEMIREVRRRGLGIFPAPQKSPRASTHSIPGPAGPISLRIIAPEKPSGVYLHIHGGGWMLGQADFQDDRLVAIADTSGLACVSVEYRLAPENPYPAGPDDCEAAALWLAREGKARFGTDRFFIGGESAGAHLSLVSLLRLRDRHGLTPFAGANLIAGCFDLGLTPSCRLWGEEKLILNTRDVALFVRGFIARGEDLRDPDISPLYADLAGLPPCHVAIGTKDPLLDDSLFLAARLNAAAVPVDLKVWPGGSHVFQVFPSPLTEAAEAAEAAFFARY